MEYGAIDLHKKESQIRIVTESGQVIDQRVATTRERLTQVFWGRPRMRVLVESSTESEWVAQHLEQMGHEVVVADPNYAAMYGERSRRIKTDRRDVAALTEACQRGTYRPAHRRSARQQEVQCRLHVRQGLTQTRTRAISLARSITRAAGLRIAGGQSKTFLTRLQALEMSAAMTTTLAPLRSVIEILNDELESADDQFKALVEADPLVKRLTTLPGIGPITASAFVATLDDRSRFDRAGQVTSYLGLGRRSIARARNNGGAPCVAPSPIAVPSCKLGGVARVGSAHGSFPRVGPGHRAAARQEGRGGRPRPAPGAHAVCHVARPDRLSTAANSTNPTGAERGGHGRSIHRRRAIES
jgi:transposase